MWERLVVLGVGFLLVAQTLAAPMAAIAATIQTDLFVYQNGDTVTVTGDGFGPDETLEILTTDPASAVVDHGTASTDGQGNFSYQFTLNATVAGVYDVKATGQTSGLTATTQFDPPPSAPVNLQFRDDRTNGGGVTLTWPTVNQMSTDCYFVYRASAEMTPRSAVNEDETCTLHGSAIASVNQTKPVPETYLDAAAPAGSLFYYITALKSGNNQGESGSSNQVATGSLNAGAGSASHNFGNVTVGTSVLFHVTYTNNGLGTITVVAPTKSGTNGSDFTISPVTPAAGSAVAVGASLTFDVTFTPSTLGARSANIEINAKDGLQTGAGVFNTHVMPISGNGVSATGLTVNSASGTYGGTVTNLQATLSSSGSVDGKAISFSLHGISVGTANTNTSGVATLPTASLTGISAGTYTTGVSSTFAGDSSLAPASATASLTVNPKSVTATVTATNKAYDGTTTATIATCLLTGVVGSDSVNCDTSTGSANFSDKNVGNGKTVTVTGLKLAGTAAGNYALSATTTATTTANITAKSLTVHFTTSDKTYDSTTNASIIGCTLDGVVGTEGVSCVSSTAIAQFANKNVANGKVVTASGFTLSGSAAASYSIGTVNASSANITPRDVAVTATGLDKLYDGNPAATVTLSTNKLTGDAVSANYTSASFANKNVGTGKTVSVSGITISGADAGNYNLTNTTASITANITSKGVVINFAAQTRTYIGSTAAAITGCSVSRRQERGGRQDGDRDRVYSRGCRRGELLVHDQRSHGEHHASRSERDRYGRRQELRRELAHDRSAEHGQGLRRRPHGHVRGRLVRGQERGNRQGGRGERDLDLGRRRRQLPPGQRHGDDQRRHRSARPERRRERRGQAL